MAKVKETAFGNSSLILLRLASLVGRDAEILKQSTSRYRTEAQGVGKQIERPRRLDYK